jgi:hypothetical protein
MKTLVICVLFSIVLVIACGKSAQEEAVEKQIEKAPGAQADVDISKKGMKITGESEGGKYTVSTGEETELPKDFPEDIFIYRPSKTIMAMKMAEGYSIALTTGDDRSKVLSAYREEMKARGWSNETSMSMGTQSVLVYEKDDRAANINIVPSDKGVQINVTVTAK